MSHDTLATSLFLVALALMMGCSTHAANQPRGQHGSLSVAVSSRAARDAEAAAVFGTSSRCTPTLSAAANATAVTCGGDMLVLRKVSVALRKIELERADRGDAVQCAPVVGTKDCEEIETGPVRFDLPLGVTDVAHVVTVNGMPAGTYNDLEFEIHSPSATRDAAFVQRNPDLAGISIRVEGTFRQGKTPAATFAYTSDLEAEQEEDMSLTVPPTGSVGVTLRLDVATWFLVDGGLIDPRAAKDGGRYEDAVRDNIRNSLRAFRDDDQDGVEDGRGRKET